MITIRKEKTKTRVHGSAMLTKPAMSKIIRELQRHYRLNTGYAMDRAEQNDYDQTLQAISHNGVELTWQDGELKMTADTVLEVDLIPEIVHSMQRFLVKWDCQKASQDG